MELRGKGLMQHIRSCAIFSRCPKRPERAEGRMSYSLDLPCIRVIKGHTQFRLWLTCRWHGGYLVPKGRKTVSMTIPPRLTWQP